MKKLDKDYLINLRCGNLMVQWLLERYRLHTPFVDLDFSGLENLDENEFRFLLELVKVYDQPRLFTPRAFDQTDIELILDYLKKTHTYYLEKKSVEIQANLHHLGKNDPSPLAGCLEQFFENYKSRLERHINQEERSLFPYIQNLRELEQGLLVNCSDLFLSKISLISFLLDHDHSVEEDLTKFANLVKKYAARFETHLAFRTLLHQIEAFEIDLTIHAAIEEQVLIPRAIALEETVFKEKTCKD